MEFWIGQLIILLYMIITFIISITQFVKYRSIFPAGQKKLAIGVGVMIGVSLLFTVIVTLTVINARAGVGGDSYGWFLLMLIPFTTGITIANLVLSIIMSVKIAEFFKNKSRFLSNSTSPTDIKGGHDGF